MLTKVSTSWLQRLHDGADRHNKDRILELCEPIDNASVLDLGCGDGSFTVEIGRRVGATDLAGVDFIDDLAATASERGVRAISHDLNTPLPFEDEQFDVVHSNQVIEHLRLTDVFLSEARRVLKPSGYGILSTNNLASWHNIVTLVLGSQPHPCHISDEFSAGTAFDPYPGVRRAEGASHLRVFAYRGLHELLELHGFEVDRFSTSGYYPFPPRAADRLCKLDPRHGAFLLARVRRSAGASQSG